MKTLPVISWDLRKDWICVLLRLKIKILLGWFGQTFCINDPNLQNIRLLPEMAKSAGSGDAVRVT